MFDMRLYLIAVALAVASLTCPLSADYEQQNSDVHQREHSLLNPYQGSGMVSIHRDERLLTLFISQHY